MHFDLTDLRLFIHIAESPSLTQGARKTFISPAAASARIKALEKNLQAQLLYRDSQGIALTDAGKRLLVHARAIIGQAESLKSEFTSYGKDLTGHVRIFANTTACTEFLPEILSRYLAGNPGVTIDLQERGSQEIYRGIADGAADLGVTSGPELDKRLTIIPFANDRLLLAVPARHPLLKERRISLEQSLKYPHVGLHDSSSLLSFLRSQLILIGRQLPLRIQVSNFEAACRMIEAGVGIGVIPESAAKRYSRSMELHFVILTDHWAVRQRQVLVRDLSASPGYVRSLAEAIVNQGDLHQLPMAPESQPE